MGAQRTADSYPSPQIPLNILKFCLIQADYSVGFDPTKEREQFFQGRQEGRKRARALTDFEQRDEDDLGFRRNDLILIIADDRDEHCWLGEFQGRSICKLGILNEN